MIDIQIDNQNVLDALDRLSNASANPRPALLSIGEHLVESTKKRFDTSTAPDGSKWEPNSQATLLALAGSRKSNPNRYRKDGRVRVTATRRLAGKKPLIGEGTLRDQISYDANTNSVTVFSTMEYAAMQQFGGKKSKFPNLWGDIPARPFLGISDDDEKMIASTISDYLRSVIA